MGAPEDTRKRPPEVHLIGAEDGFAGYVTGMEAEGQRRLVESTVLPYPSRFAEGEDGPFEALGFEFGEAVDDLFREAKLPAGWTKEGSSHSMYSFVIDEYGYRRVQVFYKAAFHHRESHMSLLSADRQQTRAQAEAYDRLGEEFPYRDVAGRRWLHDGWREGENYVWMFYRRHLDRNGEEIFDRDKEDRTGDPGYPDPRTIREIVVAPDGAEVERR